MDIFVILLMFVSVVIALQILLSFCLCRILVNPLSCFISHFTPSVFSKDAINSAFLNVQDE